jgi:hypothetical protein
MKQNIRGYADGPYITNSIQQCPFLKAESHSAGPEFFSKVHNNNWFTVLKLWQWPLSKAYFILTMFKELALLPSYEGGLPLHLQTVTLLFNPQMLASAYHTFVNAFKYTIILKPILNNGWNLDPSVFWRIILGAVAGIEFSPFWILCHYINYYRTGNIQR